MPAHVEPEVIRLKQDMTLVWPCRRGDFVLWIAYPNVFAGPQSIDVHDLWEMRDGDHVRITNRLEDLPTWFQLHPTEVCGTLAFKMMAKIRKGDYPDEPIDGPNLWRLKSGDRVAWVGADRPERRSLNGILAILDCRDCALAVGEGNGAGLEEFAGFGSPTTPNMKPEDAVRYQAAVEAVRQLGTPRTWAPEWRLGI